MTASKILRGPAVVRGFTLSLECRGRGQLLTVMATLWLRSYQLLQLVPGRA